MDKRLSFALEIIGWGLVAVSIVLLFLMVIGVLDSPTLELIALYITIGFSIILFEVSGVKSELRGMRAGLSTIKSEFSELKPRLDMLWSDFKKRRRI